jgi:hypothetical protein
MQCTHTLHKPVDALLSFSAKILLCLTWPTSACFQSEGRSEGMTTPS